MHTSIWETKTDRIVSFPTTFDLRGCSFQFQQRNATMLQKHLKIEQAEIDLKKWKKDKLKQDFYLLAPMQTLIYAYKYFSRTPDKKIRPEV